MGVVEFLAVFCHNEVCKNEWVLETLIQILKTLKLFEMKMLDQDFPICINFGKVHFCRSALFQNSAPAHNLQNGFFENLKTLEFWNRKLFFEYE